MCGAIKKIFIRNCRFFCFSRYFTSFAAHGKSKREPFDGILGCVRGDIASRKKKMNVEADL